MTIAELYNYYKEHPAVTTDSRECPPEGIFFALKGASFDGNRFALQALEEGCGVAVVDDATLQAEFDASSLPARGKQLMLVPDVLQAFKDFAREHRRQFRIPVIAITGTNGKTTTKELVRAVLAKKYRVLATEGNYNNDVGVPKTLLRLTSDHEIAVIEMGASHPGDIITLARTAEPTCGLITNVGKAHLQGFGSLDGVLHTKGELYDYLATVPESTIFLNDENRMLNDIVPLFVPHVVRYGREYNEPTLTVYGNVLPSTTGFLQLEWRDRRWAMHRVNTRLVGEYNLDNVLAAIAVGVNFGVEPDDITRAIEEYVPSNNRSQLVVTEHNSLIVDAYNANPTSMAAALTNFARMAVAPKMAIVGEMRELGAESAAEHRAIVEQIHAAGFDAVWLVGEEFEAIDCPYRKFRDVEQVKAAIEQEQPRGYHILIKGSNGTRLYQLPQLL